LLIKEAAKLESDATLNISKIADVRAGIQKKAAETTKLLEEAERTNFETEFTRKNPQGIVPSVNL